MNEEISGTPLPDSLEEVIDFLKPIIENCKDALNPALHCKECKISFPTRKKYYDHTLTHKPKQECPTCKKLVKRLRSHKCRGAKE